MDLIVNKLKIIHLKKLNCQLEKIKLFGGNLESIENLTLKTKNIISEVDELISKTEIRNNELYELHEHIQNTKEQNEINKEHLSNMNDTVIEINKLIKIPNELMKGGTDEFNTNEEYDFINNNIIKLDKLMKKYMDEDILQMRTKLLSLNDSEESDNDSLYEDSDSIDDTFYNLNMMKNMQSNKNIYLLGNNNYNEQNIEPVTGNIDGNYDKINDSISILQDQVDILGNRVKILNNMN